MWVEHPSEELLGTTYVLMQSVSYELSTLVAEKHICK